MQVRIHLDYRILDQSADLILNIQAANTVCQKVERESFWLSQQCPVDYFTCPILGNRFARLRPSRGSLSVSYDATVKIDHHFCTPETIFEIDIHQLPTSVLTYIYPSRYCQSDRLTRFAIREFGGYAKGYLRVLAIQNWVRQRVAFLSNTTNSSTSAVDTLVEGMGVCRDFAHLMIALCRALSIPARMVTGTDYGANVALGPPDLHAYVEVYLGNRWYIFDPSGTTIPLGLIRIGTGRDAADVSFATIFGMVETHPLTVSTTALSQNSSDVILLEHTNMAISTAEI